LVIRRSRENYALKRSEVEEQLVNWHESHGGLIDDPHVLRRREKDAAKSEKHIEAYQNSRIDLTDQSNNGDKSEPVVPRPSGNSIKAEEGTNADLNQRLQKSIARTQMHHGGDENKNKTSDRDSSEDKKVGTKESLSDLRSTLADVLKDAGLQVPDKAVEKVKKTDTETKVDSKVVQPKRSTEKTASNKDSKPENVETKAKSDNEETDVKSKNSKSRDNDKQAESGKKTRDNQSNSKTEKQSTKENKSGQKALSKKSKKDSNSSTPNESVSAVDKEAKDNIHSKPAGENPETLLEKKPAAKKVETKPKRNNDSEMKTETTKKAVDNNQDRDKAREPQKSSNTQFELPEDELRKLLEV